MKRYKAFDPPEYAAWRPTAAALSRFRDALASPPARAREAAALPAPLLLALYDGLLRTRLHDIALKRWVKQGVLSKAWLGTGEEAVTVGNVATLEAGDAVGPMIRNAGAAILRGVPLAECLRMYLATPDNVARGRDLHVGDYDRGVIPPTSMVGSLVPVMAGVAFAMKRAAGRRAAMTWVGDGASRTGEFHEGMAFAASLSLPLVVVLQDNGVALGTPSQVHLGAPLEAMAPAYGALGFSCDGNNVIDVYLTTRRAVAACRDGKGPAIVVARTFRMGSHATHDEAEARRILPAALFETWGRRDPIGVYEEWLAAGDRELSAWVDPDGSVRPEAAVEAPQPAGRRPGAAGAAARGSRARKGAARAGGPAAEGSRGRTARNRAALERVEARATAAIDAAAEEALASREKPFSDADAVEGVYEVP